MQNTPHTAEDRKLGLPVIPTPPSTRWREFRIKYIPLFVFVLVIVGILQLWQQMPRSGSLRGIGEGPVSMLASPQDGFIQNVAVSSYEWIEAGQPVLTIVPFDPGASMDMLQSQMQLLRLGLEPSVADRNAINYEQLRVEALTLKQELAMARANLERAEKVLPRHEALLKEKLISQDVYELTVRDRNFYKAEVDEKGKALTAIEERLESLQGFGQPESPGVNPIAQRLLPQFEAQLAAAQTNWNPVTLHAPISGTVHFYRQDREFVRQGEPLLMIHSGKADKIVAYVKQPMTFQPEVGMQMEVVTRAMRPQRFTTHVSQVGARVEVITNALAYVPTGALVDTDLPVILPVPDNAGVRPGEVVDIVLQPKDGPGFFGRWLGSLGRSAVQ